ncbi:hypothetical protein Hypma_011864 [Hypsizygus marmoreus]|uniref:gamma-glutamylcyclotransferase n=1 Tax=Hypsizygus marmoreus TaxID=39966 RepID=A0A369JG19_HYPMA|nr:hypothetical protein Hypma_011864 [Hypsizygus marmoreus]
MSKPDGKTFYFAYGSNLWLDQMVRRCPGSQYVGLAILLGWKWIINTAGYATVIASEEDVVYGMIYQLTADDEDKLDGFEGVPYDYIKRTINFELLGEGGHSHTTIVISEGKRFVDALIYIDIERTEDGPPREEYITRLNMAISDGIRQENPKEYFDKYLRPYIPEDRLRN